MEKYYSISPEEREKMTDEARKYLAKKEKVVFAVVFGSFLSAPTFRDIDFGIYLKDVKKNQTFDHEIKIAGEMSEILKLPIDAIDVNLLNFAPASFLANIFSRGKIVFFRDDKKLADMIEKSSLEAVLNENISSQSLKELVPV